MALPRSLKARAARVPACREKALAGEMPFEQRVETGTQRRVPVADAIQKRGALGGRRFGCSGLEQEFFKIFF